MSWIDDAIDRLMIGSDSEINSRLEEVVFDTEIEGTKAKGHCYCLKLDAQCNPRLNDLADYVAANIINYAIPKKERDIAQDYLIRNNGNTRKYAELKRKAAALFTDLKTTGEGGEMLLYVLVQEFLKIPQLISKMSLKTSGNVHYHGVDGVHVKFDDGTGNLVLYWGESKMHANLSKAITECFDSLKGFILDTYGHDSTQERDLQLITSNINNEVNNTPLENLLLQYFDKDSDLSNKVQYKGVCFIGFDYDKYPKSPNSSTLNELKAQVSSNLKAWIETTGKGIKKHPNLERFEIHVFLIPFPSVQDFRDYFLNTINK